jgi:hypothetical protein
MQRRVRIVIGISMDPLGENATNHRIAFSHSRFGPNASQMQVFNVTASPVCPYNLKKTNIDIN